MKCQEEDKVEKLRLGNVIDYQRDIAPYRFVEIHAGPGAGKNTLIEAFAKGEVPNAPKMRVLLITSRRAKADETFTKYDISDNKSLNLFRDKIGKAWDIINKRGEHDLATVGSTVCTSAFVAGYLKQVYRKDNIRTHLWEMYDLIVIDEAHSVMLDATYQDPPFHIYDLINYYLERCINDQYPTPLCKHIVLMTGTPDPLINYFPIKEVPAIVLDKMAECVNIQPQNIHFIESQNINLLLNCAVQEDERCIYFGNRITSIMKLFRDKSLPIDKMVVSFSDEDKRKELFEEDKHAWDNMIVTEKSIKENYSIPEQFSVFLTTSRYREGININDDIDILIVEAHNKSDVIQIAGRVRSGVKDLYIVVDAQPYPVDYVKEDMEQKLARLQLHGSTDLNIPAIKDSNGNTDRRCYPLNYMLNEIDPEQLQTFITLVETKFPYIRYSYLYEAFMSYVPRITGRKYNQDQNKFWISAMNKRKLAPLVNTWFPNAEVEEFLSEREKKYAASWDAWRRYEFKLNVVYSKETIEKFKEELYQIWGYKRINNLLSMFSSYECIRAGNEKRGMKFRKK